MVRAVLFDLDNTLIDFYRMKRICSEEAIRAMIDAGLKIDEKKGIEKLFKFYEKHGWENQKIFDTFIKKVQGKIDYKILTSGVAAYRRIKYGYLVPYPHARSTLLKLKQRGLKLGIVSDAPIKQAWLRLAELGMTDFFDFVIGLEKHGKRKPNAMPFKKALAKLKMPAEEILFVGDSPERDILGAKKLGMQTALAKYGQVWTPRKKIKADFELEDIKDLEKIVSRN